VLVLSDLLGSEVRAVEGAVVGQLIDLTIELGDDHPAIRRLAVGHRRQITAMVDWHAVLSFEHEAVQLTLSSDEVGRPGAVGELGPRELRLARDVLDTQIFDIDGKRLARVAEVLLTRSEDEIRVVAVEVGAAGVWRRLGLRGLAGRTPEQVVDWADLHLTSARGHALQLATPGTGVHRLDGAALAAVVAHLSTAKAAAVLDAVASDVAASALSASHPGVAGRLLKAVSSTTASSLVGRMPVDDATSVLRGLSTEAVDALLVGLHSDRAATLRRLLAHPADTAGGLMNTEVQTAPVGESVGAIRARVAAEVPGLAGLATVFVVDDEGHPVGIFEPSDLLAGREQPRSVPTLPASLPVQQVIDLFALQDHLALPVVDTEGVLIGAVAVDDVLEELLAERLPGQGRYARMHRRGQSLRSRLGIRLARPR